jgi:hypothetical protein
MPYDNLLLAAQGPQLPFAPTLPHRLISWITRWASPKGSVDPVDAPLPAQALLLRLLNRHPEARVVFPHLAAVERCLQIEGVAALADMPAGVLKKAQAELRSISGESDVQPLLELLASPHHSKPSQQLAPSLQTAARTAFATPRIENLEVDEVDEEVYLAAVLEWEESAPMVLEPLSARSIRG